MTTSMKKGAQVYLSIKRYVKRQNEANKNKVSKYHKMIRYMWIYVYKQKQALSQTYRPIVV